MVKVSVNVSVDRECLSNRKEEEEEGGGNSTLDMCLKIKMQMFSGDELIYEFPKTPITISSISLPSHSNIQNPTLWRTSIESSLSSLGHCPELLCAGDLLLRPTQISNGGAQILDGEQQPVCIIDLVAERVASAANSSNSNSDSVPNEIGLSGIFHFVAHVEIVYVLTSIAPELGLIFKRDLKKFNAIDELKKQAFQVASSSSSSGNIHEQEEEELFGGDCSICLQELSATGIDLIRLPNCTHIFHQKCILPWLKNSDQCPLCRDLCLQKS